MLNLQLSIRIPILAVLALSIAVAFTAHRVNVQRSAIMSINECDGVAFSNGTTLDQSFSNNLWHTATELEIPSMQSAMTLRTDIDDLPGLTRIEITSDYDPPKLKRMRLMLPDIEIEHRFEPLFDLIH